MNSQKRTEPVAVERCGSYAPEAVAGVLDSWSDLFRSRIFPGDTVFLKPNWIAPGHAFDENRWTSVITHPTLITAVLKMALECLRGRGRVIIADAPQTDSSWAKIMERMEPGRWMEMGRAAGADVRLVDLREAEWTARAGVIVARRSLPGDPRGGTECALDGWSEFVGHRPSAQGYYGADYGRRETNRMHARGRHRYKVSRSALEADVFINLPKWKTHKKAGLTGSLKNLVGINTHKNWLPHYTLGAPGRGGDQFPRASLKNAAEAWAVERCKAFLERHPGRGRWAVPFKKAGAGVFGETSEIIRSGNWHGNDTIWRMILDLNKALFYAGPDGEFRSTELSGRKRYLSIVDGIMAGDGNGPEAPDSRPAGLLFAGVNPVAVDAVLAKFMGFDWRKIPCLKNAFSILHFPLADFAYEDIEIRSSVPGFNGMLAELPPEETLVFRPPLGWVGHIER